jgi:hypothetical protein
MPDDNGESRQNRFIKMNGPGNIVRPHGKVHHPFGLEPENKARYGHDDRAPDQSKVFKLFPEIEAAHLEMPGRPVDEEVVLQGLP